MAQAVETENPLNEAYAHLLEHGLDPAGRLTVPMVGEFKNGIGIFTCDDEFEGKPIIVRYIWSNITANSARWGQAFSPDGGKTRETNWVM